MSLRIKILLNSLISLLLAVGVIAFIIVSMTKISHQAKQKFKPY
ncbi:hypothetical protein [Bacillus altitudinis]|nr:hypothetical protein [Bacillus altitudinis]WLF30562.1 hypothetical protein Q6357_19635 [Bacillus altitudinis]